MNNSWNTIYSTFQIKFYWFVSSTITKTKNSYLILLQKRSRESVSLSFLPTIKCLEVITQPLDKRDKSLFLIFVTETISRTDEGHPRPKYIFNKCGTNIYSFTLQRLGPSPAPNFKRDKCAFWDKADNLIILYFYYQN